jgi:glycosyltransferase involved in cell wall biosynthesis
MKIALFVPEWPPGRTPSGIVTYASQLVPALRKLDHEVFILTFQQHAAHADPYTINLQRLIPNASLTTRIMRKLAPARTLFREITAALASALNELIDKHNLDVFEIEESYGWSVPISMLNQIPVVVRLHGPRSVLSQFVDFGPEKRWNYRRIEMEGRGIKGAQLVTAPSSAVLQLVKDFYRFNLTASRIIPNPIEAAPQAETWSANSCRRDTLLFVGRFDTLKGGDLVLRTFAKLAATRPQLRLTFIGPDVGIKMRAFCDDNYIAIRKLFVRRC